MTLIKQRGVNLIEVMVTIAITSIGLLGLGSLQLQANRTTADAGNRSQAVWMLEDLTNRMRANVVAVGDYDTSGVYQCPNSRPTPVCSPFHNGTTRVNANLNCTNAQLAAADLWEVACASTTAVPNSNLTRASAADFIANPELTVAVATNNAVTLTLSWDVRTSGTDADGNTVYMVDQGRGQSSITTRRATITTEFQP